MKKSFFALIVATVLSGVGSLFAKDTPQPVRLHVDVDRTVLPADSVEHAVIKIGLDCVPLPRREARPLVNLALVIDRSGSMSGDRIAKAREAALELVRRLGPDDIVSLIAFDSTVETLVSARRVGDARELETAICRIEARGNTALYGGVNQGALEVRRHMEDEKYVNRIILLSDGMANVGPSTPEDLGRLGSNLMRQGIAVSTIGLGLGFNEDLMARLAQSSDGNTYFVENSADLPGIFATELGDVLNVVARRVVISVDFPEGVRPLNFVGREGNISGQKAELTMNQLYGGQEKFALVEVEIASARSGVEREVARANVTFEDVLHQRVATASASRAVKFSVDSKVVIASANHQVQADYAVNALAVAKDKAIALVDAGRRDEAAKLMRQQSKELKVMGDAYGNTLVQASAAASAPEAEKLEREGLGNAARKSYRAESQQVKNQQSSVNSYSR